MASGSPQNSTSRRSPANLLEAHDVVLAAEPVAVVHAVVLQQSDAPAGGRTACGEAAGLRALGDLVPIAPGCRRWLEEQLWSIEDMHPRGSTVNLRPVGC
jgi:hypothetical protein